MNGIISMNKLTIFTPTYNRAHTLGKLYDSLVNQTNKDFVWLVVDDGSTDNTKVLIDEFMKKNKIEIRYYYQENSGKAMAHNLGVEKTKTELFTCVDSDDYLTNNAVNRIIDTWKNINKEIGIAAKRISPNGEAITKMKHVRNKSMTLKEAGDKGVMKGDTFLIYKTEEIQKFKFPKFKGEKFVPETYLYDQLDQQGNMYLLDEGLYVSEYLEDGYTRNFNKIIVDNPNGYLAYFMQKIRMEKSIKNLYFDLVRIISVFFVLDKYQLIYNHYLLSIFAYPIGYFLYLKRFKKWRIHDAE